MVFFSKPAVSLCSQRVLPALVPSSSASLSRRSIRLTTYAFMPKDGALGGLLTEQLQKLRDLFNHFDLDQDGLLNAVEVGTVLQLCGFEMSQSEVRSRQAYPGAQLRVCGGCHRQLAVLRRPGG
jgi:hypothetical protein